MDILDEVVGIPNTETPLEQLVVVEDQASPTPKGAIVNRAATTSLLSGNPETAIENFRLMVGEAEQGQDIVGKQLRSNTLEYTQQMDMQGVMSVLGDPNLSLEQKKRVVANIQQSQFLRDQGTTLLSNSLTKASEGETKEAEDARLSSIDAIAEIYRARTDIQGLVNAHGASLPDVSVGTAAEMLELYVMPFGNSINTGKLNSKLQQSFWQKVKGYLLPGTTVANLRERLESIPPEKRVEFAKALVQTISSNSGIVFGNDNQFAQFDKAKSIFEQGGYSGFQEFVDNVSPLLDAVGVGMLLRGSVRTSKLAEKVVETAAPVVETPNLAPKKTVLSEALSRINRSDFEPSSRKFTIDDLVTAGRAPTEGGSVLLGGTGRKVESTPKVAALLKPETREARLTRIKRELEDELSRIELNSVVRLENPASPANIIQQGNPEHARQIHAAVVAEGSDEFANAAYGVSREQAIINDTFPQVVTESGAVVSKPVDMDRPLRRMVEVPEELKELVHNSGGTFYTKAEKARARANVVNQFAHAEGLTMNEAMSSFKLEGNKIKISAVYGTPEGSFVNPVDAFLQARSSLGGRGIQDGEITLLRKEGLDHVPYGLQDEIPETGNFLVKIDTFHEIDPTDITRFENLDVKRNLFDRIPSLVTDRKSSVTRYLFDAASVLHPTYTGSASVVSDATAKFEKFMISLADEFAQKFTKFEQARKDKIDDYIREANYNEIKFDTTDLVARGFTADEIDALRSWRKFWDSHYYLENYDVIRTLRSDGFKMFQNKNTELYAKPIEKNQNLGALYDPSIDKVIVHSKADGDALYLAGGTYAKLRRPVDFNGSTAEYMIVRNTPSEYLRPFRDTDSVLNYRNGYFQIQYTAPRFVDEIQQDGKVKTVAVAGDTAEAQRFADRMALSSGLEYRVRGDERALRRGEDTWWDVNNAQGRIAQRYRGKLLEDASGLNHLGGTEYIVNPVDSAIRAAKSISGRTVSRPMLEASKARFMSQYERLLPSNGHGGVRWPNTVKEIGAKGEHTSKEVADARTTYEYINYLENGYVNSLDDVFKAGLNTISEMLGKVGASKAERAVAQIGSSAPTSLGKNAVFTAYIGMNPLRQWIVQTHQVVRTFSYNPIALFNGALARLPAEYLGWATGIGKETDFSKFVNNSGLLDSVDKNNLVRGTLVDAADSTNKTIRAASRVINIPRKIGFDVGEQGNLLGHLASVYDKYTRNGRNLNDLAVRDEAYSEVRALSYDMNFAGDLPYNQTSPSMILQFMQVPHKAFLQMTNRRLPRDVRARMFAADTIMWGVPGAALMSNVLGNDVLPENPAQREVFLWGLESYAFNNFFDNMIEDKVGIDFSSLAPYDMTGWGKFFEAMYSGGLHDLFMNSPAGQLFFKDGSRFEMVAKSMGRYFGLVEDDEETPETFLSVMNEVAKISSGYNNAVKAKMLLDASERLDQYGSVIDKSVNHVEAWAQLFGFGTVDTRDLYRMSQELSKDTKSHREEVLKVYDDIKRYYTEKLAVDNNDPVYVTKVTGRILRVFKDDPQALSIIRQKMADDLSGKDNALLALFMRRAGIPDLGGLRDQVLQMPVTEDQKKQMLQMIEDMKKARETLKEVK